MERSEAIGIVRKNCLCEGKETLEALRVLIPELAESEDEKIRKAIIKFLLKLIGRNNNNFDDSEIESWIAWLEKQKPVELSKEDKENFAWFDKFFRAESVIANGRDIPQDKYQWFKSLKPQDHWKPTEQKPAWSEEDEDMVDNIFKAIQHLLKENESWGFLEDCLDWLKALKERAQPRQEWSEEDETVINKSESWLDTLCDYLKDSSSECIPDIKDVINKLKSLKERYTWKPSDEQMKALDYVLLSYIGSWLPELQSLLNDLKKLKG